MPRQDLQTRMPRMDPILIPIMFQWDLQISWMVLLICHLSREYQPQISIIILLIHHLLREYRIRYCLSWRKRNMKLSRLSGGFARLELVNCIAFCRRLGNCSAFPQFGLYCLSRRKRSMELSHLSGGFVRPELGNCIAFCRRLGNCIVFFLRFGNCIVFCCLLRLEIHHTL